MPWHPRQEVLRTGLTALAAAASGVYLSWRWVRWTEALPKIQTSPDSLLAPIEAVAVCASLPIQQLGYLVRACPGSEHARFEPPVLIAILERLVSAHASTLGTISPTRGSSAITLTSFGVEYAFPARTSKLPRL